MDFQKLNKWLKKNGFDIKAKKSDSNYFTVCDDCYDECIYLSNKLPERFKLFKANCKRLGVNTDLVNDKTLIFLHELGHYETLQEISNFVYWLNSVIWWPFRHESKIEFIENIRYYIYYNLPVEKSATIWAKNYILFEDISELNEVLK